jgi:hypothetical protein
MFQKSNERIATRNTGWNSLLLGFVIFGLAWILYIPWREIYAPPDGDSLPLLVDGLLLAADASWKDWFTHGYSQF